MLSSDPEEEVRLESDRSTALAHVSAHSSGGPMDASLRVTVQFQPDRVVEGHTVLDGLRRDGVYRSQFWTGVSSGGLTAHP